MIRRLIFTVRPAAAALWLAMLAIVSGALVPPGWMISPDADSNGFRIEICTGQGARTITLGPDGELLDEAPGEIVHDPACAFAQGVHAALGDAASVFSLSFLHARTGVPTAESLNAPWPVTAPPARGPPLSDLADLFMTRRA